MDIKLAGYNIDTSLIKDIKNQAAATPETISAAYARISRSSLSVTELRENSIAEVENARKSNDNIIFEMGHSSVAEHAVFNFDLIGVSRYLSEIIQKSRLASFTEKSQRYVTLSNDYVIPEEIENSVLKEEYTSMVEKQFNFYRKLYDAAKSMLVVDDFGGSKKLMYNRAKEDARYVLPLAMESQMGMTISARNLERLLRRLDCCDLTEASVLKEKIESLVKHIAPSLIKYTTKEDYYMNCLDMSDITQTQSNFQQVHLTDYTEDADLKILASLIFEETGGSYLKILENLKGMAKKKIGNMYNSIFCGMKAYHNPPKAFEMAEFSFQMHMSSSCFAQLKRHRMLSLIYCRNRRNFVMPELLIMTGLGMEIDSIHLETLKLYDKMEEIKKGLGDYILMNGHGVDVILKANLRELYHVSRLRSDSHAQWEIRELSLIMDQIIMRCAPFAAKYIMGKDQFQENV